MPTNEFYDSTGVPAQKASLSSSSIRAEFDAIESGFLKLPVMASNGDKPIFINSGGTAMEAKSIADANTLLGTELTSHKDASSGYCGLTLFKINFKNALNTITSFFTNSNTSARTYTFQDRDGTIADNTDLATKADASALVSGLATKADSADLVSGLATKADSSAVTSSLALKADIASPSFTGIPSGPTASSSTDTTQLATTEFVQNVVAGIDDAIGVGQTWQKPTRIKNFAYANTAGRPICVAINVGVSAGVTGSGSLLVGASDPPTVEIATFMCTSSSSPPPYNFSFIIPAGHYYKLEATANLLVVNWAELR